jgi:hypothetical protein
MPFQTTTHFVSKPIPGPGQRLVHGRLVGPTDETYPPGTGGALPNPKTINYSTTVITTVRDMNSGHTQTRRALYVMGTDEDGDKAAKRAQVNPGSSIMLGRPHLSDTAPELPPVAAPGPGALTQAGTDERATRHVSAEDQAAMDAHYSALSRADQRAFLEAYPNYVPGPGSVMAVDPAPAPGEPVVEGASVEKETAPAATAQAPAGEQRTAFVAPKGAAKGPTTSAQIDK